MLHRNTEATAFFDTLAPELSRALTLHWGLSGRALRSFLGGQLHNDVQPLSDAPRRRFVRELLLLLHVVNRAQPSEVLLLSTHRFSVTRPDWTRSLRSARTADVVVRLMLEAPETFARAHAPLLTASCGALAAFRGEYIADVVPSRDRIRAMSEALQQFYAQLGVGPVVCEQFVDDHQFSIFANKQGSAACQLGFSFFFEAGVLCIRAATRFERAHVSRTFARIFADDLAYFEPLSSVRSQVKRVLPAVSRWPALYDNSVPS